jgi:predicted  nucleic acid-binding Zn-ribbon protein
MAQSTAERENQMLEDAVSRIAAKINHKCSEIAKLKEQILFLESPVFAVVRNEFEENLQITGQNIKLIKSPPGQMPTDGSSSINLLWGRW